MFFVLLGCLIGSSEAEHNYEVNEEVILWYNRGVFPLLPSESYSFNDIPLCSGKRNYKYIMGLANIISGIEPLDSGMPIYYLQDSNTKVFCKQNLSPDQFSMLEHSIQLGVLAEFYIDNLPIWVDIGKVYDGIYLFTTYHLTIHYNSKNIIKVSIQPDNPILIYDIENERLTITNFSLSFSVTWIPTEKSVKNRMNAYYENEVFNASIHWFSLLNNGVIILIVCGVILLLMYRTLSNDFKKYNSEGIFDIPSGWKQIRNEIWQLPVGNFLFIAMACIGVEISVVFISMILFKISESHNEDNALSIVIFFSGYIGGYISSNLNQSNKRWITSTIFASCFIPILIWIIIGLYTFIGIYIPINHFIASFGNIVLFLIAAWTQKIVNINGSRINYPLVMKKKKWYHENTFLISIGGFLPFICIALELNYFLASFLTYQYYYMYIFALLSIVQVYICEGCIGIVISYIVVNTEDHRWQWTSFLAGGSLGIYIWIYAIYFYLFRNGIVGVYIFALHITFICIFVCLATGATAYFSARVFLYKLYDQVKID